MLPTETNINTVETIMDALIHMDSYYPLSTTSLREY